MKLKSILTAALLCAAPASADTYVSAVIGGKHFGLGDGWVEGTSNAGIGLSTDIGDNGFRIGAAFIPQNSYGDPTVYFLASKDWQVTPETDFGTLFLGVGGGFSYGYDPDDLPHWDHPIVPAFGFHARYDVFNNGGGITATYTPMGIDRGVATLRIDVPIGH